MNETNHPRSSCPGGAATLAAIVLAGIALRGLLLWRAENQLDCDESLIAFMALDILEGRSTPLFVYGTAYDGGGAFEAYLAAGGFAIFGVSPIVPKACALAVWGATAILLAGFCARRLPSAAVPALLCFCVGTPFFLEWSLKARGGFAETALLSVVLLWLFSGPDWLERRPWAKHALIGALAGIGLWISEMLLAMIACVFATAVSLPPDGPSRRRTLAALSTGLALGLMPLIVYNATHDFANLRESVVYKVVAGDTGARPLSPSQLFDSARFVLGPVWWLALPALPLAAYRVCRSAGTQRLVGFVLLAHLLMYTAAYWLAGLRALPVPASRVLFAVYPTLAIVLGIAAAPARDRPRGRNLSIAAGILWCGLVLWSAASWLATAQPRESGSWRGQWSLYDTRRIYDAVRENQTHLVLSSYWASWPLAFEARSAARQHPSRYELRAVRARHVEWQATATTADALVLTTALPGLPVRRGIRTAVLLIDNSPALESIENALRRHKLTYRRILIDQTVILVDLDAADLQRLGSDRFAGIDGPAFWPPRRPDGDGFN